MAADPHSDAGTVLGIFAKQPVPGAVKTRLAADTSPEWAARVADACLRDTLGRFSAIGERRILAYSPPDSEHFFAGCCSGRFEIEPQAAGDLGQRMEAFFDQRVREGAERTVLIGTDSPTLGLEVVHAAWEHLRSADLVLGPSMDGGYYLIGCARRVPPVFTGKEWGGATVFEQTVADLPSEFRLAVLPPWYDVDTLSDWHFLRAHVIARLRAGEDTGLQTLLALLHPPPVKS